MPPTEASALRHYERANHLMDAGDPEEAIVHYMQAGALVPGRSSIWHNLALAHRTNGDDVEAEVAAFRKAIAVAPYIPDSHMELGLSLKRAGRLGEAVTSYRRAIEEGPDAAGVSDVWYNLGNVFRVQKNMEAAVNAYRRP